MKVVILAGGLGTRLMEETDSRPKPMVEIGGKPILWHIMKMYQQFGYNDFVICLGYKAQYIKQYFYNYFLNNSDFTIDLSDNSLKLHVSNSDNFKITLVDTGLNTNTAGRIKKIQRYVANETFMLTYGDGVSDINIENLVQFHFKHGKIATLTSVQTPGRFGKLDISDLGNVGKFTEKPQGDDMWINGGFFVLEPEIFNYLKGDVDNIQWEHAPLANIAADQNLMAFKHYGFWKCMDALRDRIELEKIWNEQNPPWKNW